MLIKLVISDVDGVLTDGGMYYSEHGDELKRFNTRDGMGFQLLREAGYKTAIITSEDTKLMIRRANKIKCDYLRQGHGYGGKLAVARTICKELQISLHQVAYIGDDLNCVDLLEHAGLAACPADAVSRVISIDGIHVLTRRGGEGAFREFSEYILSQHK